MNQVNPVNSSSECGSSLGQKGGKFRRPKKEKENGKNFFQVLITALEKKQRGGSS